MFRFVKSPHNETNHWVVNWAGLVFTVHRNGSPKRPHSAHHNLGVQKQRIKKPAGCWRHIRLCDFRWPNLSLDFANELSVYYCLPNNSNLIMGYQNRRPIM